MVTCLSCPKAGRKARIKINCKTVLESFEPKAVKIGQNGGRRWCLRRVETPERAPFGKLAELPTGKGVGASLPLDDGSRSVAFPLRTAKNKRHARESVCDDNQKFPATFLAPRRLLHVLSRVGELQDYAC